jgi:hypothetical protein
VCVCACGGMRYDTFYTGGGWVRARGRSGDVVVMRRDEDDEAVVDVDVAVRAASSRTGTTRNTTVRR